MITAAIDKRPLVQLFGAEACAFGPMATVPSFTNQAVRREKGSDGHARPVTLNGGVPHELHEHGSTVVQR